jgi:outer membrane protein, heavy metal efflux system
LDELLANSPQVREADIQIELARREFAREQAQPIPNITLQTVATWDRALGATTVSTLVAVPVPVFNRNQGNIYHTWASIRTAVAEAERVRLVLGDLLSETYRRHQAAQYQVERLRHDILPDAKENFDLVTTGQKQGEFTLFQVLLARHTYSQSQLTYVEALTELQKVNVELSGLLLTGGLNPSSLGAAIQMQTGGAGRQRALINQIQESTSKQLLPPALQSLHP